YDHYWINTGDEILVCTEEANAAWLESHGTKGEKTGVLCGAHQGAHGNLSRVRPPLHSLPKHRQLDPVVEIRRMASHMSGLKNDYNKRTMWLLVSDIGCVVMGVTAALCYDYKKWIFYCLGLCYGSNTYFHAAKVYIEGYHTVPKGHCRNVVRLMAWCFYMAWTMFPILFLVGPEGLGKLSGYGSTILHTVADVLSKQLWTLLGHHLRVKIHEHIIIHGNLTKTMKVTVAGEDKEVEEMVDSMEEGAKDNGTSALAGRESFIIMRDRMKQKVCGTQADFHVGAYRPSVWVSYQISAMLLQL
ncbi:putative channel rhodopsin, partial [Haematococcus lacustris]